MNVELAAECLIAVKGLYPSEPITRADALAASRVPKETEKAIREFIVAEEATKPEKSPHINYLAVWKRFSKPENDRQLTIVIEDPAVADTYLATLSRARAYLKGAWHPQSIDVLLFGPKLLAPCASEEARCQDLYAMANDPRRVLNRLSSGNIMAEETALLRTCFPEFIAMVAALIDSEMLRKRAERKTWELPYRQEVSVRALTGMEIGTTVTTINDENAAPEPEMEIATKRVKADAMTKADRVEDSTPA